MLKIYNAEDIIVHEEIEKLLEYGYKNAADVACVNSIIDKAKECKGIPLEDVATLPFVEDKEIKRIIIGIPLLCIEQCRQGLEM